MRLHDFEGVERAAESGFGVGDDGGEPVDVVAAFDAVDLIGAAEGAIDALD